MKYLMTITLLGWMVGCAQQSPNKMAKSPSINTKAVKASTSTDTNLGTSLMQKAPALHTPSSEELTKDEMRKKRLQEIESQEDLNGKPYAYQRDGSPRQKNPLDDELFSIPVKH